MLEEEEKLSRLSGNNNSVDDIKSLVRIKGFTKIRNKH